MLRSLLDLQLGGRKHGKVSSTHLTLLLQLYQMAVTSPTMGHLQFRPGMGPLLRLCATLVVLLVLALPSNQSHASNASKLRDSMKAIWKDDPTLDSAELENLRQEAWHMFDHGYSNYIQHAMPQDNLLPLSCKGQNWQGGLGLTLVDALDSLLLMNRRADMQEAVELLRKHVNFDKDVKVHVFETIIRVLGGLLSGHSMLHRDASLVPGYDGLLLRLAVDLADRLLPAFNTTSGLPALFVNLRHGIIPEPSVTCTACAGTLLLEFGLLSSLTGDPTYMDHAHRCAKIMYNKRSSLGLIGSSLDIFKNEWASKEATIGPGVDSYYEYLLKAYLMFGEEQYLDMFLEVYSSTMQYLSLPINIKGYGFMVDVDSDTGRLNKPFVSSLGAFWPGMQALIGQEKDAVQLHANFTAAWRAWGWLPEVFLFDLSKVHPEDPGYNLRPEHVESTYLLHCLTGSVGYLGVARKLQKTLAKHNRGKCGFASIVDVGTGEHQDLQESFFLSETMKYLYLIFSNQPHLVDYLVLTTEGHIMPIMHSAPPRSEGECRLGDRSAADATAPQQGERGEGRGAGEAGGDAGAGAFQAAQQAGAGEGGNAGAGAAGEGPAGGPAAAGSRSGIADGSADELQRRSGGGNGSGARGWFRRSRDKHGHPVPRNCAKICREQSADEQQHILAGLRSSFPLLHFDPSEAELLRQRRCHACVKVTHKMLGLQLGTVEQRADILKLSLDAALGTAGGQQVVATPKILAQVVCVLLIHRGGRASCNQLRAVTPHDAQHGLPSNAVVLQLSLPPSSGDPGPQAGLLAALVMVTGGLGNAASLLLPAVPAGFGGPLADTTWACLDHLTDLTADESAADLEAVPISSVEWSDDDAASMSGSGPSLHGGVPPCCSDASRPCRDQHAECRSWALRGECVHNPVYMLPHCPLACELCPPAAAAAAATPPARCMLAEAEFEARLPAHLLSTPALCRPAMLADGFDVRTPGLGSASAAARACDWLDWSGVCREGDAALWAASQRLLMPRHATGACSTLQYAWGPLVLAQPETSGCLTPVNGELVQRAVAVVMRGSCSFAHKVITMQRAGAVGVIVVNNAKDGGGTVIMSGDAAARAGGGKAAPDIRIPAVMVSHESGRLILQALRQHERSPVRLMAGLALEPEPEPADEEQEAAGGGAAVDEALQDNPGSSDEQAAGAGAQCSAQEEQQTQATQQEKQQQQQQQQQQRQQYVQPQLDLMIPTNSQAFLQANVMKKGINSMNILFNMLIADGRAMTLLMSLAQESMAKLSANETSQNNGD